MSIGWSYSLIYIGDQFTPFPNHFAIGRGKSGACYQKSGVCTTQFTPFPGKSARCHRWHGINWIGKDADLFGKEADLSWQDPNFFGKDPDFFGKEADCQWQDPNWFGKGPDCSWQGANWVGKEADFQWQDPDLTLPRETDRLSRETDRLAWIERKK